LVAEVGFRRQFHFGGLEATKEVSGCCHLQQGSHVSDVGCASGKTACYLAKHRGYGVIGVGILGKTIQRSNERANREGVEDKGTFGVADAQKLPFQDNLFDAVIGEFITGLLRDKRGGIGEYLRVTKPGGYVGLDEATWVRTPAPAGLTQYLVRAFGVQGGLLTSEEWTHLLAGAGLRDVSVRTCQVKVLSSWWDGLEDIFRVWYRVLQIHVRSSAFGRFGKETLSLPKDLFDYFGYGIYVGRK
jgi:ubiquinone/menaquinone biosynthesis C-methylase UbiE